MAYLKLRSNTWFGVWRENGKKVVRSTKVKAKGKKEKMLAQVTADSMERAAKGDDSVARAVAAVRAAADALGIGRSVPSVEQFLTEFQPGGKEQNVKNARRTFRMFLEFLGPERVRSVDQITAARCREFCLAQLKEVSFGTVKQYVSQLKAAFNVALMDELISRNPWCAFALGDLVPAGYQRATRRLPFSMEELKAILCSMPEDWRDLMLATFLTGGQRLGDIACLQWSAVRWERGVVELRTTKVGRLIEAPMVPMLHAVLAKRRELCADDELYVFPQMASAYARGNGHLSSEFTAMLRALGILDVPQEKLVGRRHRVSEKSFHSLRHTVVTVFRSGNVVSADMAREIIGHSSEAVERAYFTPSLESKRRGLGLLEETIGSTNYEVRSTK